MEKILVDLIQDRSTLRKLQILEILNESNEILSSTRLAKKLQCTSRTIINDISQLKLILPKSWDLVSVKSKGYLLKQNSINNFSYIIGQFLLNSELYKILTSIFNYKYYTLEKWSQLLYVNKLTLNKILKKFNNTLKHFELKFSTRKIKLVGNELNIRYFFIVFFYNIQMHKDIFNLNTYLQKEIEGLTRRFHIEIDYNLLWVIINVSINRIVRKQSIHVGFSYKYMLDFKKLKFINSIISKIVSHYQINLSENELNFFILTFSLISEGSIEEKGNITHYFIREQQEIYNTVSSLLKMIADEINIGFQLKEKIKYEIFFYLYKMLIFAKYNFPKEYLVNKVNDVPQELFEGYNIIYPLVTSCIKNISTYALTNNDILYITYTILNVLHSSHKKNGILLLSGPSFLKDFIYNKLNTELGNNLTLHSNPDYTYKFDFIIANYQINNNQVPVIQISHKTIQKDLKYIKKVISPYYKR